MSSTQAMPTTAPEYAALLHEMLSTFDNNRRRAIENGIVRSLRDANTAFLLVQLLNTPVDMSDKAQAGVRQLAAVLLRKRVLSLWRGLPYDNQNQLKEILLTQLSAETDRHVRLAIAHVVCVLGKVELPTGWDALITSVQAAAQSASEQHRDLAMVIIQTLAETLCTDDSPYLNAGWTVVTTGLADPNPSVARAALRAVGALVPFLYRTHSRVRQPLLGVMVPNVLAIVSPITTGHAGRIDGADAEILYLLDALETLEKALEVQTADASYTHELLSTLAAVCGTQGAHLRLREEAGEIITCFVASRPKAVVKRGFLQPLFALSLRLLSEDETIFFEAQEPEPDAEEADTADFDETLLEDTTPPCMIGGRLLTMLADELPSKHVYPLLRERIGAITTGNADARDKKAAVIALAACCSGCSSKLRAQVTHLIHFVATLLTDASPVVRESAAFASGYMCQHLQPEILQEHVTLMPLLLQQLDDSDAVRARVTRTLEAICEHMGDDIEQYVGRIIPKLIDIIPQSSLVTQRHICGALASMAQTKSPSMVQHAPTLFQLLQPVVAEPTPILLRAQALEAVGILGVACGAQFEPYFQYFWSQCVEALSTKYPEMREQAFGFCANMAELLGESFHVHLATVMPFIKVVLEEDNGVYQDKNPLASGMEIGGDEDSDDEGDTGRDVHFMIRTADIEEKTAAVYCLGVLAGKTKAHFAPYQEFSEETVSNLINFCHDAVRENAIAASVQLVVSRQAQDGAFERTEGTLPRDDIFTAPTRSALDDLVRAELLPLVAHEVNKQVVAAACDALVELVNIFGAVVVHPYIDELMSGVSMLLAQKAPCQEGEDDEENEDGADHDGVLIDSASEIVDTLAEGYGPSFAPFFNQIEPLLLPYCGEDHSGEDQNMAAGVLGKCIQSLGVAASGSFDTCVAAALQVLSITDESAARSNACYLLRALIDNVAAKVSPQHVTSFLQALHAVITNTEELPGTRDNAIAAVCSLVSQCPGSVPMPQVLPAIFGHLPMKQDTSENEGAARCLANIAERHIADLLAAGELFSEFVKCCGRFLSASTVDLALKQTLARVLHNHVIMPHSAAFTQAAAGLPERHSKSFSAFLY